MSKESALARAREFAEILAYCGVKSSIELQMGRAVGSLDRWDSNRFELPMNHDTVATMKGLTPSLYVCKHGRGKEGQANYLPGPLCNGYGGRDLIYRIITMGPANHPGLGGPLTIEGIRIPQNNARPYTWGTEWEHDGVSRWPDDLREMMARFSVAYSRWKKIALEATCDHDTWAPGRKIDRSPGTRAEFLEEAKHFRAVIEREHNTGDTTATYKIKRTLEFGDNGEDVKQLQRRLNQYIFHDKLPGIKKKLVLDGSFGPATADAIAAFKHMKKFEGMDRNRKVGKGTVIALGGFLRWGGK